MRCKTLAFSMLLFAFATSFSFAQRQKIRSEFDKDEWWAQKEAIFFSRYHFTLGSELNNPFGNQQAGLSGSSLSITNPPLPAPVPLSGGGVVPNTVGGSVDFAWNQTTVGIWGAAINWTPNSAAGGPNAAGLYVTINTNITGPRNVNLFNAGDAGVATKTIGQLDIGDSTTSDSFTLQDGTGGGVLNFNGNGVNAQLNELSTSNGDTISAPITLSSALDITNASANTLTLSGGITAATAGTKTITASTGLVTMSGVIGNGSGTVAITQNGSGTLTLTQANTFGGGFTLTSGTVNIGNDNALSTGTMTINGGTIQGNNGTARAVGVTQINVGGNFTIGGTNTGALSFSAPIDLGGATRQITDNNTTNATVFSGVISNGGLTKLGDGQLNLTGASANTYPDLTTVSAGTLGLGKTASVNAFGGDLTINGGAVLYSAANDNQIIDSAKVTISSGTLDFGSRNETIGQTATATSGFSMSGGAITKGGTGTVTIANSATMTGGTITSTGASGAIALNTDFNFSGGTIDFTSASGSSTAALNLRGGSGTGITYSASGTTTAQITNSGGGSARLSLNTAAASTSVFSIADSTSVATEMIIAVPITGGTGAVQKTGAGVLVFSGANTYTVATQVNGGTLLVNGSLASGSTVTVTNSGSVLGGSGTVNGTVAVGISGATIRGGTGTAASGSLTLSNNLAMGAGSVIQLALASSAAHSTLARTGGTWTFDATQAFNFINVGGAGPEFYNNIITGLAADPGIESGWTITNAGWAGTFTFDGANIDLSLTAAPEPSTWISGILLVGLIGWSLLKRRHAETLKN